MCVFQKALLEEPQKRNSRPVCFRRIQKCCSLKNRCVVRFFFRNKKNNSSRTALLFKKAEEASQKKTLVVFCVSEKKNPKKEDIGGVLCFRKEPLCCSRSFSLTHSLEEPQEPQKKNPKRRTPKEEPPKEEPLFLKRNSCVSEERFF